MYCALCTQNIPAEDLDRVSGLDLCTDCRATDPRAALADRGIPAEWDWSLGAFSASLGIPGADPDFQIGFVPELLHHKALKLLVHEVEVGDPTFDSRVYVRTSDKERAARVLGSEGVQSALLGLLVGLRSNDIRGSHVSLEGAHLSARLIPLERLDEARVLAYKLELAVLAIHLMAAT